MNKIYPDADERLVNTVILYSDGDKGEIYYDSKHTKRVRTVDFENLFIKGLAIIQLKQSNIEKRVYLKPSSFHIGRANTGIVYCATGDGRDPSAPGVTTIEHHVYVFTTLSDEL